MYLADHEKETYTTALEIAFDLYDLTSDRSYISIMYDIIARAKAAVLRNEIRENEILAASGINDTLFNRQTELSAGIAAYNRLILEESQQLNPDSAKISLWKDDLFEMNRQMEKVTEYINLEYPGLRDFITKTKPLSINEIQKEIDRNITIIDYFISNQYNEGERVLFMFIINYDNIYFRKFSVDSLFTLNAEIIKNHKVPSRGKGEYLKYTGSLNYMYKNLVLPAEDLITGNRLIIIPDEEISWLPYEAFLKVPPPAQKYDYENLSYLVRDYAISYGFSSSLLFSRNKLPISGVKISAFSPHYGSSESSDSVTGNLPFADLEVQMILKRFRGKYHQGSMATETNFREATTHPSIFHLSMHSITDTLNSRFSWLAFDAENDTLEDGNLYNYEISLMRLRSPMVVLSACNSGSGTLYHGEGLMSMARSFILAGASSVIRTSWEVNDETSSVIITSFYKYLSLGKPKDKALQKAKLDYLENTSPTFSDPYYWAAYQIQGNTSPVVRSKLWIVIVVLLVSVGLISAYLIRRRISDARSL